jgi:hypothetical protein
VARDDRRLLGVHILGDDAAELIHIGQVAIHAGMPVSSRGAARNVKSMCWTMWTLNMCPSARVWTGQSEKIHNSKRPAAKHALCLQVATGSPGREEPGARRRSATT